MFSLQKKLWKKLKASYKRFKIREPLQVFFSVYGHSVTLFKTENQEDEKQRIGIKFLQIISDNDGMHHVKNICIIEKKRHKSRSFLLRQLWMSIITSNVHNFFFDFWFVVFSLPFYKGAAQAGITHYGQIDFFPDI